ncbi:MAG: vWA domain-containing protein [Thiotrichaceae bacterium]|nr:vWA domain-containing protein [Thiotrichaceae bacterium]
MIDTAKQTVSFADAATEQYRGYIGSNATTPNILLNAGNAARTAELTRGVELETLTSVSLVKNEAKDVTFSIKLPETTVNSIDIVFLIDVSGSYQDDIDTLQSNATGIVSDLKSSGIDVQFGVASFSDFPLSDYGNLPDGDEAYFLHQKITPDTVDVISAINNLDKPLHNGGDDAESQLEAFYQLATGLGRDINGDGDFSDDGELSPQSIGWRTGALKVILFATDAYFHDSDIESSYPGAGKVETITALQSADVHVVGLQSGNASDALTDIRSIVNATNGSIHSLSSDSAEIAQAILDGLNIALEKVDITIEKISGSDWISNISPISFSVVTPGSERQFNVSLLGQKSKSLDKLNYDIYLWVIGDGSALLKRVKIPVIVP